MSCCWHPVDKFGRCTMGHGTYVVANDGDPKIRLGIAEWDGEWHLTDGLDGMKEDEIELFLCLPDHPGC